MNRDAARELFHRVGTRPETPLNPDHNPWLLAVAVGVVLSYVVAVVAGGIWWSSQESEANRVAAGSATATTAPPEGTARVGTTRVTIRPGSQPSTTDPATIVLGPGATNTTAGLDGNGVTGSTTTTTGPDGTTDPDPDPGFDPGDTSTTTEVPLTTDTEPPVGPATTLPGETTTTPATTPSTTPTNPPPTAPTTTTSSVTTTMTTPPLVLSIRVTPSVVEAQRWEMDAPDAPVLTWSVDPAGSLNGRTVKVTGPDNHGFTDMTPSGRRTLCPGTVVAGTCTRSVGEWTYTLTVADAGGTVIDTRTATITVL